MVTSCASFNCTNRYQKGSGISFHKFPLHKPELLSKWLVAIKRDKFVPTYSHRLCSIHFTEACFWKSEGNKILKDDAVPTLFDFPDHLRQVDPQVLWEKDERERLYAPQYLDGTFNTTIEKPHLANLLDMKIYPPTKEGLVKQEFFNGPEVEHKTLSSKDSKIFTDLYHNFTHPGGLSLIDMLSRKYNKTAADVIIEILFGKSTNTCHPEENKNNVVMRHEYTMDEIKESPERDPVCKADYGFYPDPEGDCNAYYACQDGKAEKKTCSIGLHFNPVSKLCDYIGKGLCQLRCPLVTGRFPVPGYCDTYLECTTGQPKFVKCAGSMHFNALTKQCDDPSNAACEVSCPTYDTLVSLPGRCNMYARCEEGNVTYYLCPSGLHFNPIQLKCDMPEHAQCDTVNCPKPDGYFPVLGQCGTYIVCQNNHLEVHYCPSNLHFNFLLRTCDKPSLAHCNVTCKKPNGYFPLIGVCSHYIKCLRGTPFLRKCPGDQEFNSAIGQCDTVSRRDHCLPHCVQNNGIFPIDNHCDLYIRCSDGRGTVKRCPSNLHFNALFKRCDIPERAMCHMDCPYPSGMFPVPGRCTTFLRCEDGEVALQSCAKGLHFNARTMTCDWPDAALCEVSCPDFEGYFPVQGACNAYVACSGGQPYLRTCPAGKHFNFDFKRCDIPEVAKCELECSVDNGLSPVPGHCDSYVRCEDDKPHMDTCATGLLFNHFTQMCDIADNVDC